MPIDKTNPRALRAHHARLAAERARRHRKRVREARAVDGAIVDALVEALVSLRPDMTAAAFVRGLAGLALVRLGHAGQDKPRRAFDKRLGLPVRDDTRDR